jgi:hypothetical protein
MQPQSGSALHPLLWVAGVALIVFCGVGAAAMMGWIGGPAAKTAEAASAAKLDKARPAAEKPRTAVKSPVTWLCLECGVVQSVHEVDSKGAGSGVGAVLGNEVEKQVKHTKTYEITVRFDDGAIRMITEPTAPSWRVGDKVKVLNGVIKQNS